MIVPFSIVRMYLFLCIHKIDFISLLFLIFPKTNIQIVLLMIHNVLKNEQKLFFDFLPQRYDETQNV